MRFDTVPGAFVDSSEVQIDLLEFSVVVVAQANNPTILNPDFLRHNGIVGTQWHLSEDHRPATTSLFSEVAFEDGLAVKAYPNKIIFEQSASALSPDDIECADMAKCYLKTVPHVPYIAFGINLEAVVLNSPLSQLSNVLRSNGSWMTFESIVPRFELRAIYEMAGKRLALDLHEGRNERGPFMLCQANIHRDIEESNQQMRINSMLLSLDSWRNDLNEFRTLVAQSLLPGH